MSDNLNINIRRIYYYERFNYDYLTYKFFEQKNRKNWLRKIPMMIIIIPYIILQEIILYNKNRFYILYENVIVGVFALEEKKDTLVPHNLAISPEYRNKGLGTYAFRYWEIYAKNNDLINITFKVLMNNVGSLNLCKKLGYKIINETRYLLRKYYILNKKMNIEETYL